MGKIRALLESGDGLKMLSYFKNQCPHCKKAAIFSGIYRMNRRCPHCGEVFERESGYFIGAMIASYFIGVFLAFPPLLLAIFVWEMSVAAAILLSILLTLALQPFLFRYSRILWIRIEAGLTRSIHGDSSDSDRDLHKRG
jgi:uncharacterized protein (DUF983 family)